MYVCVLYIYLRETHTFCTSLDHLLCLLEVNSSTIPSGQSVLTGIGCVHIWPSNYRG